MLIIIERGVLLGVRTVRKRKKCKLRNFTSSKRKVQGYQKKAKALDSGLSSPHRRVRFADLHPLIGKWMTLIFHSSSYSSREGGTVENENEMLINSDEERGKKE
jgi:hypothetical protein